MIWVEICCHRVSKVFLRGSNQRELTGAASCFALAGSKYAEIASARAPKGLLSAEKAIDVEVMGMNPVVGENPIARLPSSDYAGTRGPIDADFVNLGIEKDLPGSDNNFLANISRSSSRCQIKLFSLSIDLAMRATTMLVAATKRADTTARYDCICTDCNNQKN